jgi:hypothetical protein
MRYRINRTDNGAKALQAYADSIGFVRHSDGGAIDDYLAIGQRIAAVEYKSKGGTLTPSQQRIIAKGFPVRFISSPEQLDALKLELSR